MGTRNRFAWAVLVLVLALPSCEAGQAPSTAPETASPTTEKTTPSVAPTPTPERAFDPDRVEIRLREVASGFDAPVGIVDAPDDQRRLHVVEQPGRIRSFPFEGAPGDFLDITDRVRAGGEQGLLGLAFHPRYEQNSRFYVNYTDAAGDTVIAEYRARGRTVDPASEQVLLTVDQPFANHNGGQLAFGPEGYLYIALGDGGSGGDPENNGQRTDTLLGKLLRIDVDGRGGPGPYGIPDDNPFAGNGRGRAEIWAYGLRNPWRFSFDRETGDLWIADVGQSAREEVNREPADSSGGRNYGWRAVEGDICYVDGCDPAAFVRPLVTYGHDSGCSITGGYVYRGADFPNLRGAYVFGDYCSGNLWAVPARRDRVRDPEPALSTDLSISSFGEDSAGEIYVADAAAGAIYRVVDAAE